MTREEVFSKVKDLLAQSIGEDKADSITEDALLMDDLGLDSLETMDLIMNLESEFGISIPDEDIEKIKTVGDVVNYIMEKI